MSEKDAHAECRRATARAWTACLNVLLDERMDDGTPVLAMVFSLDPALQERLRAALATRPIPPARREAWADGYNAAVVKGLEAAAGAGECHA